MAGERHKEREGGRGWGMDNEWPKSGMDPGE